MSGWLGALALLLADDAKLMVYRLRGGGVDAGDYLSGSWISPDGTVTALGAEDLWPNGL